MKQRATRVSQFGFGSLALLAAVTSLLLFPASVEPALQSATATPSATQITGYSAPRAAAATAVPAGPAAGHLADDFEDVASGWPKLEFSNFFMGYHEPTYYRVQVSAPDDSVVAPYLADVWRRGS